jgi:hypothetical protein
MACDAIGVSGIESFIGLRTQPTANEAVREASKRQNHRPEQKISNFGHCLF